MAALLTVILAGPLSAAELKNGQPTQAIKQFFSAHCLDCHTGPEAKAGLDLATLSDKLDDPAVQQKWVRIVDRVHDGEMPPPDVETIEPTEAAPFLQATGDWLRAFQRAEDAELGRVRGRRLTRRELERSLHDLLGIDIPLADQLAGRSQLAGVLDRGRRPGHVAFSARTAPGRRRCRARRGLSPGTRRRNTYERDFDAEQVARQTDRRGRAKPEMLDGRAVTWSSGLIFYGRIPATTAPENGWYRFKVRAGGLKPPASGGVWTTVRSGLGVSSAPLLAWVGAFEATPEPREIEFEAWLPKGHMLEIRPGDTTLKKARVSPAARSAWRRRAAGRARHRHRPDHDAAVSSRTR